MYAPHKAFWIILAGLFLLPGAKVRAGSLDVHPVISIIIDDLGYQHKAGLRALRLDGEITYAFLPRAPFTRKLAEQAYRLQKEIMLHLPMESEGENRLGPGALTQCMSEMEFKNRVRSSLAAVPHVQGFNNHMGSYLTKNPRLMSWLMQTLMFRDDLYFVDSRTTTETVAQQEAERRHIATTRRDIFLDYERDANIVAEQLVALVRQARRDGTALAIGHPYP
ncbi:MAG: divergent polysaccharide deacetylase family protein [Gammaproteobacteria bacterium]